MNPGHPLHACTRKLRRFLIPCIAAPVALLLVAFAQDATPFPTVASKKGLQVQMVDDAIALGIKHAALNVDLAQLIDLHPDTNSLSGQYGDAEFRFKRHSVEQLDQQIKPLSDRGIVVSLILLCYENGDSAVNQLMLHPQYNRAAPNHLSAFNTASAQGAAAFRACIEFLAERYSQPADPHGRVWNYIVGNEVNSHWFWANMGRVSMEQFARDYLRTVRACHEAVRRHSAHARVYVSLEHHWMMHYPGGDDQQTFPARPFLDYFAKQARETGDFEWHVAFHPYPENLFDCRTWKDKTALPSAETPRITFKNIEVLPKYLEQPELLFEGRRRHVILSEQGFHTPNQPDGETLQAAAFCYAYYKVSRIPGIDSFILHRHVDHGQEGGLNLGLWSRNRASRSPAEPLGQKKIYSVFKAADTPNWAEAFAFALPVIGITKWEELLPPTP